MSVTIGGKIYHKFCNFYNVRFELDGLTWFSVEQAYQAYKFKNTDYRYFIRILNETDPREAYILGQTRNHTIENDFDKIKGDIMKRCITAKFLFNKDLILELVRSQGDILYNCGYPYWDNVNSQILLSLRERFKFEGYT